MKKLFLLLAAATLLVFGFCACDEENNTCSNESELEGTWTDACHSSDTEYRIHTLIFTGDKIEWNENYYTDDTCSTASSTTPVSGPGYFVIAGDGAVSNSNKMVFIFDDGSIFKTIYLLTGKNNMQIGDEDSVLDSAGYPTALNAGVFTRQ